MPSISLQTFSSGDTDYVAKHNSNNSAIQSLLNTTSADVEALKAAGVPGADLDFRLGAFNLLINGGFDYWQRGTSQRPDAWVQRNGDGDGSMTIARESSTVQTNTYSAKTVGAGQLTQNLPAELVAAIESGHSVYFGCYVYTNAEDQARIGIYDGTTTTWSTYHSGTAGWEWKIKSYSGANPSALRFILDSQGGTVYWCAACVIRGNPSAGPIFVANPTAIEYARVLSLYEAGGAHVRGVGQLVSGDRELEQRITFAAPKLATPTVMVTDEETGYDIYAYNVDRSGFNIVVAEIGGASGTDGFSYPASEAETISWTAEVSGT